MSGRLVTLGVAPRRTDPTHGGADTLAGVLQPIDGAPLNRRVRLHDQRSSQPVREVQADAEGNYQFANMGPGPWAAVSLYGDQWIVEAAGSFGGGGGAGEIRGSTAPALAATVRVYRADTHAWSRSTATDGSTGTWTARGLNPSVAHYALVIPDDSERKPDFQGPFFPRVP